MVTPSDRKAADGYFSSIAQADEFYASTGPDFVNLDEKLEAIEHRELDTSQQDEAHVRRLVKRGAAGPGTWIGNVLGWGLFSVEENEEESEDDDDEDADEDASESEGDADLALERRRSGLRQLESLVGSAAQEERIPPPKTDEGGWQDAAWLLSVASKVLL
jgi:hypothetical protein